MHPAALDRDQLLRDCTVTTTRRGGPGGQHRNKVETAVVIRHDPTGVAAEASERRSQADNRAVAVRRLRIALAVACRSDPPPHEPSSRWCSRRRGRILTVAAHHEDFPALLAEAFDVLHAADFRVAEAAEALGVSSSQLTGLVRKAPSAWTALVRARSDRGLPPLR